VIKMPKKKINLGIVKKEIKQKRKREDVRFR